METKRVTEDFSDRWSLSWTLDTVRSTMDMIESLFEDCDTELANAGMSSLGYESQDIDTLMEHLIILRNYVCNAHQQCYEELDHPLYEDFTNGATQALSEIVLSDITTDNTFGLQEYVEVPESVGSWYMTEVKTKLTMEDFLGLEDVTPETGLPSLANMEALGWFTDLFRADYELMGAAVESVDELLEIYLYAGEYSHKEYHPIGNFISGILDVTIIKPFIESIYGKDLITGEKLTDFERGMQLVNAVIGAVTLGQGALAMDFTKMAGKEIAVELLKIWGVDAISDMAAFTVGYTCDELGMPAGVSFIASLLTGCTVSTGISGYVFTDAGGNVVKELDVDEMQAWLKEMDVDLDDMAWGGGKGTYKAGTDAYESLLGPVSDEELERYMKFLKDGSQAGLTQAELMGIKKVDEYLALSKVDYDEVLALRKGVSEGGRDVLDEIKRIDEIKVEFNYNSKYDETEFARQLAGQQKGMNELTVQEYLDNRQKYIEQGRAIESNAAQQAAREKAFVDKVDELQDAGLSLKEAEEQAQKWLDTQAALHNPDQVAGGHASNVGGVGDKGVNSSIGSQWRYRIDGVDVQIQKMSESMSEAERNSTYLNVNLIYKGD